MTTTANMHGRANMDAPTNTREVTREVTSETPSENTPETAAQSTDVSAGVLFSLRDGQASDLPVLNYFAACEGMDALPGIEHIRVAVNVCGEPVGFCRLARDECGIAYVNPVVVCETWRGYGVGRALIEDAHARAGELRLVARGDSVGFYERLGFEPLAWDEVDLAAASEDCERCPMRATCEPAPLRLPCNQTTGTNVSGDVHF